MSINNGIWIMDYIDDYAEHLRAASIAESTITARVRLLKRLRDYLPDGLDNASTTQLEAFLAERRRTGCGRASIYNYNSHIRAFYAWADGLHFDGDPALGMRRPKAPKFRPRPCSPEELKVALSAPEPWLVAYVLAYYEGMRAGEIAEAERQHVTAEVIYIPSAKGGDSAVVPTHPSVWALLRNRPDGRLIRSRKGLPVSAHYVSNGARKQLVRLGLSGVGVHRLRHRFATDLIEIVGADLRVVQTCLRHASLATTQYYTEVTDQRKRAAVAGLPSLGTPAGSYPAGATAEVGVHLVTGYLP